MEKVGGYPRAGGRFHFGKDRKRSEKVGKGVFSLFMFLSMFPFCFSYDVLRRSKTLLRRSKTLLRRILSCFKTRFDALRRYR